SYDNANELIQSVEGTTGLSTTYSYDAMGSRTATRPAAAAAITYTYDQANRLTSAGIATIAYGYDGDGLRATKTTQTPAADVEEDYVWDVVDTVPLLLMDKAESYIYGPQDVPIEQITNVGNNVLYFHQDQLGSTRALTNG